MEIKFSYWEHGPQADSVAFAGGKGISRHQSAAVTVGKYCGVTRDQRVLCHATADFLEADFWPAWFSVAQLPVTRERPGTSYWSILAPTDGSREWHKAPYEAVASLHHEVVDAGLLPIRTPRWATIPLNGQ